VFDVRIHQTLGWFQMHDGQRTEILYAGHLLREDRERPAFVVIAPGDPARRGISTYATGDDK
jgi:hypothetical protein